MNSSDITKLAIKRHDIDAHHFQLAYNKEANDKRTQVFLYGRNLVIEELQQILDALPRGSKVLDVGCGTAHLTNWIKEQGFTMTGVEPSSEMMKLAKENFPDIEVINSIASALPFEDNSFDLIVSFEVLRYLDKPENIRSYKEFYRVLKPGGKFFVTQVNLYCTDLYYFFHNIKSVYCRLSNKVHHFCNFTTSGKEEKLLKQIGFSEVNTVGRLAGSVRLFYKLGGGVGKLYSGFVEMFNKKQRYKNSFSKNTAGHLIVIAKK
jgi:ubiquinone/menaquinone biosynthesis C-methylase UbiE